MQKLASEFKTTFVITRQEKTILGSLEDFIINPDTGSAVGLSFGKKGPNNEVMVTNTSDITGVGTNFIMIESVDKVSPADEIIRIKEILDKEITLVNSRVVDEDERHLGTVTDYSINLKTLKLERLYVVTSSLIKMLSQNLIIPANNIVKIEKGKITVRSGSVKSKEKVGSIVHAGKTTRPKPASIVRNK